MKRARWIGLASAGLLVVACVGLVVWSLRETEPTVTGTVRLNNELLSTGSVAWIPIEGTPGPGGGAGINSDGTYEIRRGLRPGKYRVEIRSSRTLNRQVRNPTIPADFVNEEVAVIPERYNTRSELFCEIGPGSTVIDFNLDQAPGPK